MTADTFASYLPAQALVSTIAATFEMEPANETARVIEACFRALVEKVGSRAWPMVYAAIDATGCDQRRLVHFEMLLEDALLDAPDCDGNVDDCPPENFRYTAAHEWN